MSRVGIIGVGTLPWRARYADKTPHALIMEAVGKALADARLTKEDVTSVVYSLASETVLRQQMPTLIYQDYIGCQTKPSLRVEGDSATGLHALYVAYGQVASGMSDVLLLVGIQKCSDLYSFDTRSRGDGILRGSAMLMDTIWLYDVCAGVPAYQTLVYWLPSLQKRGAPTAEQVARVSVKNHRNALANPESQLKLDLTSRDVMDSRIIAHPTTRYECCLYSDCAAALVLVSEKKAKEMAAAPVWISGISVCNTGLRLTPENLGTLPGVRQAARKAYAMAGIKEPAAELDLAEVHDLISAMEILTCEELGLCAEGQGGKLAETGFFDRTGELPVNPSGGRVACGHSPGVSSVYSTAHVVRQLLGRAGGSQVKINHGKGLVEAIDSFGSLSGVAILERS